MHALYEGMSRDTHDGCHTLTKYTKALYAFFLGVSRDIHNGCHTSTKYTKALYAFCLGMVYVTRHTHGRV